MPPPSRYDQENLELSDEDLSHERLDSQVQKAQDELSALRRKAETIERQKRELEELARRQELLHNGRSELVEKFTRALVVVEREGYEAQKRVELLQTIHDNFTAHLQTIEAISPKTWDPAEINRELTKALSAVDDARVEYNRSLPKISVDADEAGASAGYELGEEHEASDHGFLYWLKAGTAFTLPLTVVGVILLFILISYLAH